MAEHNGLSGHKFEFLEQLAIEDLEYLLCLSSDAEETETFLDAITEVIIEREKVHPTGRLPNVDNAWNEFLSYYNAAEKMDQIPTEKNISIPNPSKKTSKKSGKFKLPTFRRIWPIAATAVITLTVAFTSMVGVQAAGVNVFGALAQWTGETFHFVPSSIAQDPLRIALRSQGMPEDLAFTALPRKFTLKDWSTFNSDEGTTITASYSDGDLTFWIEIGKFSTDLVTKGLLYEIDDFEDAEAFISHGRKFFILSNADNTTATWSDDQSLVINLWGNISIDDMRDIISSIGG